MAQGALTARIQLVNASGEIVGTEDVPLNVDDTRMLEAINALTEQIKELKQALLLTFG